MAQISASMVSAASTSGQLRRPKELRVVLDCTANHFGRTLNGMLPFSPVTMANLVGILILLRKARIALSA